MAFKETRLCESVRIVFYFVSVDGLYLKVKVLGSREPRTFFHSCAHACVAQYHVGAASSPLRHASDRVGLPI